MKKCKAEVKRGGEEGAKRRISGVEAHEREEREGVQRGGYQVWNCMGERRWRRCSEEDIRCGSA